jgi:ABC-type transport system substrate-binding protein
MSFGTSTTVALEAFKAGVVDWRTENSAKNWATAPDFSAVGENRVLIEEFPIRNVGTMQAFAFNIRREKFQDARVRLAFNYAFDFEKMNKLIFYGQYKRIASYFENTELAATGLPTGKELQPMQIREHDGVGEKQLRKPFYYLRWFYCLNKNCRTTTVMPERHKVMNSRQPSNTPPDNNTPTVMRPDPAGPNERPPWEE